MGYDVIVVGAGPAGSVSAALFAAQGRRVLLLDAARFPRPKPCAEYISPGGVAILVRLGALERLRGGRRLRGMQLVAPGGAAHTLDYGTAYRGLSVARRELDHTLLEIARERGADVRDGFRVRSLNIADGGVTGINGSNGETLDAQLTVGADGLHSVVARDLHLRRTRVWPRHLGLVAHFDGVDWPEDTGQMRVSRWGYVGAAPLDDGGLLTVGLVTSMPRGRLGSPIDALNAALANYPDLAQRLSHGKLASQVTGVGPLATRVKRAVGRGYALVGDAAGFFDPFTGEGIFRALRGAELLAACPDRYATARRSAFTAKDRLVNVVQMIVQQPVWMEFAIRRLNERPAVARELSAALGDLAPSRLSLVWRLLGP